MPSKEELIQLVKEKQRKQLLIAQVKAKQEQFSNAVRPEDERLGAAKVALEKGVSFGARPFLAAATKTAVEPINRIIYPELAEEAGGVFANLGEKFSQEREKEIREQQRLAEKYPKLSAAGEIGGALLTAPFTPVKTIAQGAKLGLAAGSLKAAGEAETPMEAAKMIGESTALGGAIPAATKAVGKSYTYGKELIGEAYDEISKKLANLLPSSGQEASGSLAGTFTIPRSPNEAVDILKKQSSVIKHTPETRQLNKKFSEMGLAELSPIQMQKRAYREPTPAQYAESIIKSKDPATYIKQLEQVDKYDKAIESFRELGESTREDFGIKALSKIEESRKKAGAIIGKFKANIAEEPIHADLPPFPERFDKTALHPSEIAELERIKALYSNPEVVTNFRDLDNISSQIGKLRSKDILVTGAESAYTRELSKLKNIIEEYITSKIPDGKPREAYLQYTKAKNIYNDTLRGALKTGQAKNVFSKITASKQNYDQFVDMAMTFEDPSLVGMVKAQYIKELASQPNVGIALKKAKNSSVYKEILSNSERETLENLGKYYDMMKSTFTSVTNPSRSGIVMTFMKGVMNNPIKGVIDIFADGAIKESRAVGKGAEILKAMAEDRPASSFLSSTLNKLPEIQSAAITLGSQQTNEIPAKRLNRNTPSGSMMLGSRGKLVKYALDKISTLPDDQVKMAQPINGGSTNIFYAMQEVPKNQDLNHLSTAVNDYNQRYGAEITKDVFDGISKINGIITPDKLYRALPSVPEEVRARVINEYQSAFTSNDPTTPIAIDENDRMLIMKDIKDSNLTSIEKARAVRSLLDKGLVAPDTYRKIALPGEKKKPSVITKAVFQ